jgi:hypothetical protein
LYRLKQAGRQWKVKLEDILLMFGFEKSLANDCLYILREDGQIMLLVLVYIDDMAVAGPNLEKIKSFKVYLSKAFEITDLGELQYILGIQVSRDCSAHTIRLNQTVYIN